MLTLISPAKSLDFESPKKLDDATNAAFADQTMELAKVLKGYSARRLAKLMGISESLAELNYERFQDWETPTGTNGAKPAVFAFTGDVYQGLSAERLTARQLAFAQDHLRILSGFHGLLRPLDLMLPYRLEMGTELKTKRGKNLYEFWGDTITMELNRVIDATKSRAVLNLASNEYFRSVKARQLEVPVIAPVFKEFHNGKYKIISFFAKKARGTVAAWAIRNRPKTHAKLTQFNDDGYHYDEASSTEAKPVFLRKA